MQDGLWLAREAGEYAACDELFLLSEVGSGYEDFGLMCGYRDDDVALTCVERFGDK